MSTSLIVEAEQASLVVANPLALLQLAIDRGADPDKLGKLVDLAERMETTRARKAFAAAMNDLQAELPSIVKDAKNPHTNSPYARLETIAAAVDPFIIKHGFSISFGSDAGAPPGTLRLYIDIRHREGHTERVYGDFPSDKSGAMNPIQGVGSTYTYARRYLICNALNITVKGQDNDGGGSLAPINKQQVMELLDLINDTKTDTRKFLAWAKIETLEQMPAKKFQEAIDFFNRKKGSK